MLKPLERAVVRIYSKNKNIVIGSGFLAYGRHIITCTHVVADSVGAKRSITELPENEIILDFPRVAPGKKLRARVAFLQPLDPRQEREEEDIAGLELIDPLPEGALPAQLVDGDDYWDHQFQVLGFPSGQQNGVWASGVIRSRIANGRVQIEDTKQPGYRLEPGFSGAPVWDEKLEGVAGIAVLADLQRPETKSAFIIPADILIKACSQLALKIVDSPYRGLSAFREQDAQFFFGRERFKHELIEAVETQSLVTVIGPSGSGKSSLVFAGLNPTLTKQNKWIIGDFRPKSDPFFEFCAAAVRLLETEIMDTDQLIHAGKLKQGILDGNLSITKIIECILEKNTSRRLLLVIDQFEELYTLCQDEKRRCDFLEELLSALRGVDGLTVVLTLRADFLGYALSYRPLADIIPAADQMLGPMNHQELRDAIEKPIKNLAIIEPGLTERILEDLENEPGNLPLLEFTLMLLWENKEYGGRLTHRAYEEIGGVDKALAEYAEGKYQKLRESDQRRAKQIFIQLVQPGDETQDTRRLATRAEVGHDNWDLVKRLADDRLVVTGRDESTNEETVEVVHEALIREWDHLKRWIGTERNFRLWQERLKVAYRKWMDSGQQEEALLQGIHIADAEDWLRRRTDEISPKQNHYIKQSIRLRDRKRRRAVYTLGIFSTVVSVLGILAGYSAVSQANEKINAQFSLSEAQFALNQRLDALREGIVALREMKKLQPWGLASENTRLRATNVLPELVYGVREKNRFNGHEQKVEGISYSFTGQFIVSTSEDQTAKVWNPKGLLLTTLEGHSSWVNKSAFSANDQLLATASSDGTVKLWEVECLSREVRLCVQAEAELISTLEDHTGWVTDVSFSPGGAILASSSRDGTVKLWNTDGSLRRTIDVNSDGGEEQGVWSVAFAPDSETLATANEDGTIRIYNIDGNLQKTLTGHSNRVRSIRFNDSGDYLVSGGDDETAIIWTKEGDEVRRFEEHSGNVNRVTFIDKTQTIVAVTDSDIDNIKVWNIDGTLLASLNGHTARVKDAALSPDGTTLLTGSWDKTVRLWNLSGLFPRTLKGHSDRAVDVSFSPDGETLASSGWDATSRLWGFEEPFTKVLQHADKVNATVFSPDGELLVSISVDGKIIIFDNTGSLNQTIEGHESYIRDINFSPDSQFFVTAGGEDDPTVKLWSRSGQLVNTLRGHAEAVYGVSFSPDGKLIASASADNTVMLWDNNGQLIDTLQGHTGWVWNVSFSPDSQTIASASEDFSVKLWSLDGELLETLQDHSARVSDVVFSPDGKLIATGSADSTIKLWSKTGELITTLEGHRDRIMSVSFSPDGQRLASASVDGDVKIWDIGSQEFTADLDTLLNTGCTWLGNYLKTNQSLEEPEQNICDNLVGF